MKAKPGGHKVKNVSPGSPAAAAGIRAGWKLLGIDDRPITDIIDYKIMEADESLTLLVLNGRGYLRRIKIVKPPGTALGLSFEHPTISPIRSCGNRCIFCFIDQNPPGMRPALYLKDDDYRMSFLYGNFITLNRDSESDIKRIISLHLSPLYVSVHATDPVLRRKIFGTKNADRGLANLKKLVRGGIRVHAQVVLCPGYNSGKALRRTIKDLARMGPNLLSIALVPVGLTGHRANLPPIKGFSGEEACALMNDLKTMQEFFLQRRGTRFVYAADELYLLAGEPFPADGDYEGYPQLENGVGLARLFLDELEDLNPFGFKNQGVKPNLTVVTGKAAAPLLEQAVNKIHSCGAARIKMAIVPNIFFGERVSVSGLLTGADIMAALEGKDPGDAVIIAGNLLKDQSSRFLDDMNVGELEKKLGVPLLTASGPREMYAVIRELGVKGGGCSLNRPGRCNERGG